MVQIECLIIGVNFIITRKVAAPHRLYCPSPLQHSWQTTGMLQCHTTALADPTIHRHFSKSYPYYTRNSTQLNSLTNRAMHLCKCIGVADPLKTRTSPPSCYHAELIGRSALKGVGIKLGERPKLGRAGTPLSWDWRRESVQYTGPSLPCVTTSNVVVLR